MAKRIPKTVPPEKIAVAKDCGLFSAFCEVIVPLSPMIFTYAVPEGVVLQRGSVVWVQLSHRKPTLGVVSRVISEKPAFAKAKTAFPHASGYVFSERFMEKLEWTSRYYLSTQQQALNIFLPKDFEKYLDAVFFEASQGNAPEDKPLTSAPELPPLTEEQNFALEKLLELLLQKEGFQLRLSWQLPKLLL